MFHFRHYTDRTVVKGDFKYGFVFYSKRQPTLDILINKHVFVVFWLRKRD